MSSKAKRLIDAHISQSTLAESVQERAGTPRDRDPWGPHVKVPTVVFDGGSFVVYYWSDASTVDNTDPEIAVILRGVGGVGVYGEAQYKRPASIQAARRIASDLDKLAQQVGHLARLRGYLKGSDWTYFES